MSAGSLALAFRAECVLGLQLVLRSRAVQLVVLLAAVLTGVGVFGGVGQSLAAAGRLTFVACGSLMAVAGSQLLATGPALAAVRRAAAPGWVHSVGRMAGVALLLWPIVVGTASVLIGPVGGWAQVGRLAAVGWVYAGAVGALALSLGPLVGASGAASLGLLLVWLGGIPPSSMYVLLEAWPHVQRPIVWLWNVLPLGWRADRLHVEGLAVDAILLAGWVALGVVVAAWGAVRLPAHPGRGAS